MVLKQKLQNFQRNLDRNSINPDLANRDVTRTEDNTYKGHTHKKNLSMGVINILQV